MRASLINVIDYYNVVNLLHLEIFINSGFVVLILLNYLKQVGMPLQTFDVRDR